MKDEEVKDWVGNVFVRAEKRRRTRGNELAKKRGKLFYKSGPCVFELFLSV